MVPTSQRTNCVYGLLNFPDRGIYNYNHQYTNLDPTNTDTGHLSTGIHGNGKEMMVISQEGRTDGTSGLWAWLSGSPARGKPPNGTFPRKASPTTRAPGNTNARPRPAGVMAAAPARKHVPSNTRAT